MSLSIQAHPRIVTRDRNERENGFLIPIFNVHDMFIGEDHLPKQVYLTVCEPGMVKGPHLHKTRWGAFTCVRGNLRLIARVGSEYEEYFSGEDYAYATIEVPPGIPAALQSIGAVPAYILNMPSPAWRPEDRDEHEVVFPEEILQWPRRAK